MDFSNTFDEISDGNQHFIIAVLNFCVLKEHLAFFPDNFFLSKLFEEIKYNIKTSRNVFEIQGYAITFACKHYHLHFPLIIWPIVGKTFCFLSLKVTVLSCIAWAVLTFKTELLGAFGAGIRALPKQVGCESWPLSLLMRCRCFNDSVSTPLLSSL